MEEVIPETGSDATVAPEQIARPRTEPQQPSKGKKAPYRALSIPERDFLYALYEKYNGNMSHMVLDPTCPFKSYNSIIYWAKLYHFRERMVENRRKRVEEVLAKMQDAKLMAIERAMEMLRPYVSFVYTKTGVQVFDKEGKPLVIERQPFYKEVKAAWEIIKTELGEPTTISKADVHNHEDQNVRQALDEIAKLTSHAKPQDHGDAVPGERGAAEDTASVPAALPNHPDAQPSAQ